MKISEFKLIIWLDWMIRQKYRQLANLLENRYPELAEEHYQDTRTGLRAGYERLQKAVYDAAGQDHLDDEEITNLLNVIRAVYLSTMALQAAVQVLLQPTAATMEPPRR